jgi:ankyrin repeat protein
MLGSNYTQFIQDFFWAIRTDNVQNLKRILLNPMLNNPMLNIDMLDDEEGMTGLGIAAKLGHQKVITLLLKNKANINAKDKKGRTALLLAVVNEKHAVTEQLLVNGADPELADNSHNTPLSLAIYNRSIPSMKSLLKYKADPNKPLQNGPYQGFTPLVAALNMDCNGMFSTLCNNGANISSANRPSFITQAVTLGLLDYIKPIWPHLNSNSKVQVIKKSILLNQNNILDYALAHTTNDEKQKAFHTLIEGVSPLVYAFNHYHLRSARSLLGNGHELLEKDNKANEDAIISKFGNKQWHNMLESYFSNLKQHEQTPTLAAMTANIVYQSANSTHTPIIDLGLPQELEELCFQAPLRLHNQSTLKPKHVRDFLSDLFNKSEAEITDSAKEIKRKNHKRAKRQ